MNIQPKTTLSGIICSIDIAQKLQELGVTQRSAFYWANLEGNLHPVQGQIVELIYQNDPNHPPVSAFTSDELIRMLGSVACYVQMDKDDKYFHAVHYKDPFDGVMLTNTALTLPDALAGMLVRLLEQKKKSVEEANQWLIAGD